MSLSQLITTANPVANEATATGQGYSADFGNHMDYDTVAGSGPMDNMPFQANVGIGPYCVQILS